MRAIQDCGFEHPSEVQSECIPQAILGMDVLCQAKSGMGKTAVFVLTTLQQLDPVEGEVGVLVMCHTRELAYQINEEYTRFTKFMPDPVMEVFIDDESKLTLHGLQQHYVKLAENEKNRKLNDLLDALEFNQVIIFVKPM